MDHPSVFPDHLYRINGEESDMDCGNGMGSNGSGEKVGFISFQADEGENDVGRGGVSKPMHTANLYRSYLVKQGIGGRSGMRWLLVTRCLQCLYYE